MGTLILRWFLSRTVRQAVDMCRQATGSEAAVIILTAAALTEEILSSIGPDAFLVKPFAAVAFLDLLYRYASCR